MNQPLYPPIDPAWEPREALRPDPPGEAPAGRRPRSGSILVAAVFVVAGAFFLIGCAAEPIEEVDVGDVIQDGVASVQPEDSTVSLSGEVDEILTESALTVTDERSEEPLLVLLTPLTMVNGTTVTLGAAAGSLTQLIPPEGTLQLIGTLDTFDSVALAERLGIVLNEELFAPWEGEPVLIAEQVDTVAPDASLAAETGLESE